MPKRRLCKAGFTLMELAVIVVIMFTMAAVLAPAFRMAAARDKLATCQSNLKELGTALQLYIGEWNGMLPTSMVHGVNAGGHIMQWNEGNWAAGFGSVYSIGNVWDPFQWRLYLATVLYPYMKDANVVWCPADPNAWFRGVTWSSGGWASYFWKAAVDEAWFGGKGPYIYNVNKYRQRISDFAFPAQQSVLWERVPFHETGGATPVQNGSKINMLFIDGHVELKVIRDCVIPANSSPYYASTAFLGEPFYYNYNTNAQTYWVSGNPEWWDPHIYRDSLETATPP